MVEDILKYKFNETYYYNMMISTPIMEKCLYCENGKHKRIGDGEIIDCPICDGKGEIDTKCGSINEEPRKCFLKTINTKTIIDDVEHKYKFVDENNKSISETIYDDIDDCINGQSKGVMGYTP